MSYDKFIEEYFELVSLGYSDTLGYIATKYELTNKQKNDLYSLILEDRRIEDVD